MATTPPKSLPAFFTQEKTFPTSTPVSVVTHFLIYRIDDKNWTVEVHTLEECHAHLKTLNADSIQAWIIFKIETKGEKVDSWVAPQFQSSSSVKMNETEEE
jgi:predicted RNase H-like HicB family nuclease